MTDPGETLRAAVIAHDAQATAEAAATLLDADPTGRVLREALWRLPYRHWRDARLWMERVRDTHPDYVMRDMFRLLRAQFERVRDADYVHRRHVLGLWF